MRCPSKGIYTAQEKCWTLNTNSQMLYNKCYTIFSCLTHHAAIHFFFFKLMFSHYTFRSRRVLYIVAFHLLPNWKPSIPCQNKYNPPSLCSMCRQRAIGYYSISIYCSERQIGKKNIQNKANLNLSKKEFPIIKIRLRE